MFIVLIVAREQKKLPFLREVIGITAPLLLIEEGIFRWCKELGVNFRYVVLKALFTMFAY